MRVEGFKAVYRRELKHQLLRMIKDVNGLIFSWDQRGRVLSLASDDSSKKRITVSRLILRFISVARWLRLYLE